MTPRPDVPAGDFAAWLNGTREALSTDGDADVPCGECTACCRSSFFIHIRPHETEALACIPREVLFPAPGLPAGTVVMGYDASGCCPMLRHGACSVYAHRPQTCRAFDCRVFSAAGIESDKPLVDEHARRWEFSYPAEQDGVLHAATRDAARFLREHHECFPGGKAPGNPAHVALLAITVCDIFARTPDSGAARMSVEDIVDAVVEARERFGTVRAASSSADGGERG